MLIPALLLLSGYLYLRVGLSRAIHKEENKTGQTVHKKEVLEGKQVSSLDLRPLFIERMQQLIKHSSKGLYNLSIGDMKVDVLASKVSLQNVLMKPDADILKSIATPDNVFTIQFKRLDIEGINLDDVITRKTMDYKLIRLVDPVIEIDHKKSSGQKNDGAFAERFLKQMQKLSIKNLIIEGATVITRNGAKKPTILKDVAVNMNDILIDSATRKEHNRFLFAKKAMIHFHDFATQTKDGMYTFKVGSVTVKAPEQQVQLQDVALTSPYNKIEFTKKQKQSKDWYHFTMPIVLINGVNWWQLLNEEEIVADEITTKGGKLSIYFDRSLPQHSVVGNFPNQLLMKMPLKMNISKVSMQNMDVSYEEYNPTARQSGTIYFDHVNMHMTHVSNVDVSKPVIVNGTALFMHRVPVNARFVFGLSNHRNGAFAADINTNTGFAGDMLNSFAQPLGMTKIEKGNIEKTIVHIKGDQWNANGEVQLLYNDLKIDLMEKDKGDNGMNKKHITSFLANSFIIKNENPKKEQPVRTESASFKRDPNGGFFMLLWKTMLVGILKTIGVPEKYATQ